MKQKIKTPALMPCVCGNMPKISDYSDNFYDAVLQYECKCGIKTKRFAGNKHRAICRWNNKIKQVMVERSVNHHY